MFVGQTYTFAILECLHFPPEHEIQKQLTHFRSLKPIPKPKNTTFWPYRENDTKNYSCPM